MDRADWLPMHPAPAATAAPRIRTIDLLDALRRDPRQAVEEEHIVCLICAARFRQLTNTHLRAHQLTAITGGGPSCAVLSRASMQSAPCAMGSPTGSAAGPSW